MASTGEEAGWYQYHNFKSVGRAHRQQTASRLPLLCSISMRLCMLTFDRLLPLSRKPLLGSCA